LTSMPIGVVRWTLDSDSALQAAGKLTRREIEIVRMVAQGLRNKVIVNRRSISDGYLEPRRVTFVTTTR
jgi:DNA-binding NarL/FixJ family response regulator